jgi:hypothetical protein
MNPAHHDFWRLDGWTRTTVYNVEGQGRISLHASTRVDFERKIVRTHLAYNVISEMQETILFEGEVVQHCLAPNDLESLVAEKGFEIIGRFGSNLLEPFRPNSSSVCLLMLVKLAHLG